MFDKVDINKLKDLLISRGYNIIEVEVNSRWIILKFSKNNVILSLSIDVDDDWASFRHTLTWIEKNGDFDCYPERWMSDISTDSILRMISRRLNKYEKSSLFNC